MASKDARKTRALQRDAASDRISRAVIEEELFEDPEEQLRYEVQHMFLHVVHPTERSRYPMALWVPLPSFMADLQAQGHALSRKQVITAIVDVVCGRAADVNSRQLRPLRRSAGPSPEVVRGDGAIAWRANVSNASSAARRIMWWERLEKGRRVELARLAVHDDLDMPEA